MIFYRLTLISVVSFMLYQQSVGFMIRSNAPRLETKFNPDYSSFEYINDESDITIDEIDEIEYVPIVPELVEDQSTQQAMLMSILEKVKELQESNNKLQQDLASTQNKLERQNNKRKVSVVQLEPVQKYEEPKSFWEVICGIAKKLVSSVLSFFGLQI